jgi:hypothetical protein
MDARWYDPNIGRFTTQDSYMGDIYTSQSLNRYSYVMNNPVNMWDPTGHVPEWVGNDHHFETSGDASTADAYDSVGSSSSSSGWNLIGKITTATEITYQYQATVTHTWVYEHTSLSEGTTITDPETGETYYHYDSFTSSTETYTQTDYYYNNVVITAAEIAEENEEYIRNLAGDPPKNNDPPAVSISTLQVGTEPVNLDQIIVYATGKKTIETQNQVTGATQSELNEIMDNNQISLYSVERITYEDAYGDDITFENSHYEDLVDLVRKFRNADDLLTKAKITSQIVDEFAGYEHEKIIDFERDIMVISGVDPELAEAGAEVLTQYYSFEIFFGGIKGTINPLENIKYTDKVKAQMKQGDYHSFSKSVDGFGADGRVTKITGGDKVVRTKVEIPGSYMGKEGVFEYIIEPDGVTCNHRLFKPYINY